MKLLSCGPESAVMSVKGSQWHRQSCACLHQHQCNVTPLDGVQWKASHNSADAGARRGYKVSGSHAVACVISWSLTVHRRLKCHTKATLCTWTESQNTLLGMDNRQGGGGSGEGGLPRPPCSLSCPPLRVSIRRQQPSIKLFKLSPAELWKSCSPKDLCLSEPAQHFV